jgi:hypothetical protein
MRPSHICDTCRRRGARDGEKVMRGSKRVQERGWQEGGEEGVGWAYERPGMSSAFPPNGVCRSSMAFMKEQRHLRVRDDVCTCTRVSGRKVVTDCMEVVRAHQTSVTLSTRSIDAPIYLRGQCGFR